MEFLDRFKMIHSWTGFFHTVVAVLSMLFGTMVLLMKKGTKRHKQIGYIYVSSMLLMNGSAFAIYNFGGFSIFHGFAIISLAGIFIGMLAVIKRGKAWYGRHFYFMNWSVVGLYCAFWSEVGTRLLEGRQFWWVVMLATVLTAMVGAIVIQREAKKLNLASH